MTTHKPSAKLRSARIARASGHRQLHRTASVLALSAGMIGLAGLVSPAAAQCVEGVPDEYTCSGSVQIGQVIVGDDISATTTPGFTVDTTANGNGYALAMTGDGRIVYTDAQASSLTGGGAWFNSTGGSGLDVGSVAVYSEGAIVSSAAYGLRVDNAGGGDTTVVWWGSILNTAGHGVFVRTHASSDDLAFVVGDVTGLEDGVRFDFDGGGSFAFSAQGSLIGETGAGLRIQGGTAGADYDIQLDDVSGGTWGVLIDNEGTDLTRLVSTGTITGLGEAGVTINGGVNTTDINLSVNQVNGETYGLQITNAGTGSTSIVASGRVAAATLDGIVAVNDVNTGSLSITTADVFGRSGVIAQNYGTGATQVVSSGLVTGFAADGVRIQNDVAATDVLVQVNDVSGDDTGVEVFNWGSGDTTVQSTGLVTGDTGRGIGIETGTGSQGVTVEAVDVAGAVTGIYVLHEGSAGASVTTTGLVTAGFGSAISVENGVTATDITIQAAALAGGSQGVRATNNGLGSTVIGATGPVSGGFFGILAANGAGAGDMTIEVADVTSSSGTGIDVVNLGSGLTQMQAQGLVFGGAGNGISVQTGTASQGLGVYVDRVQGQENGIILDNQGSGATVISATGAISAEIGSGIFVNNGLGTTEVQIEVAGVDGGDRGISVSSLGTSGIYINATGPVSGDDFGILAETGATGDYIVIDVVDVFSDGVAILASNVGDGSTEVTSTGTVAGTIAGIRAFGGASSANLFVEANNASGGMSGIAAVGDGLGPVDIFTHGVIEGGDEGIEAFSANNGVTIVNDGVIRNLSGLSSDRAIDSIAAFLMVQNQGTITGQIDVLADASLLVNEGVWNSAGGTSLFAGADDAVFNQQSGTVYGGGAAGAEVTVWSGLELFMNSGRLQMLDGGAGDTLETSANAVFEDTADLAVDIGGAGVSDVFRTTGSVEIEPGSTLIVNTAQPLILNSQYLVVEAGGGLNGQFEFEDEMITAFAGLRDGYTANTAFVEFVQLKALVDAGLTPNQQETAEGSDSLPDGDPLKDALLLLPTDEAAQEAFDQLSGEIHPAGRTAMAEDSRLPRTAVLDRLGYGEPERSIWGRAFGSFGASDGDANAAALDRDSRGMIFGVDKTFGGFTVGLAAGAFETELDISARNSEATVESVHALAYAGGRFGAWAVRGGVGYAVTSTDTRRQIAFPGFSDAPEADYDGSVLQGFVEAGYRLSFGGGHLEPFLGLTALQVKTDAFAETGGPAALSGASRTEQTAVSTLGVRFETDPQAKYSLRGSTGWRHGWGDLDPTGVHAFDGGAPFTILAAGQSSDAAFATVEGRWKVSPAATFGLAYDGVLGSDGQDQAITGSLRVVF